MGTKLYAEYPSVYRCHDSKRNSDGQITISETQSFKTLINWNVSKVLKSNPRIDLKAALQEAQERLEDAHCVKDLLSPDTRNLICALLAWQQLGHSGTDSLFNFVQQTLKEEKCDRKHDDGSLCTSSSYESNNVGSHVISPLNMLEQNTSKLVPPQWGTPYKEDFSSSIGLVVKLPVEPQTMVHVVNNVRVPTTSSNKSTPQNKSESDTTGTHAPNCMEKTCMQRLTAMEEETQALRRRAARLAQRERLRNEQLESAEKAWYKLEAGYQRRLRQAEEKEEDQKIKVESALYERNRLKDLCTPLVERLKKENDVLKNEQAALNKLETEVCSMACTRAELAEKAAHIDAELTGSQCKASQLDRDHALKEEQERRKNHALTSAVEATKIVIHELTHAQREELQMQREQVAKVSEELLEEDARTEMLQKRVEDYMSKKGEMLKDLEAYQVQYKSRMSQLDDEWKRKKEQLKQIETAVLECECKDPVDRVVEAKRTPSLAAVCKCTPSNMESCSCTSLRSRLLSALLSDLFGGLKSEMEVIGSQMPCHLLKCLEDKHNWDRSSDVKQNIRFYFSQLLRGELDIAIATVIENCHGQWVGECCADRKKTLLSRGSTKNLHWQERELELKTQKMAQELAEKMFQEKAKELALQAQEQLFKEGRPPCGCDHSNQSAVYSCLVPPYQDYYHLTKIKGEPLIPSKASTKDKIRSKTGSLKKGINGSVRAVSNHKTNKLRKTVVNSLRPESTSRNDCNIYRNAEERRISNVTAKNLKTVNKVKPEPKSTTNKGNINDSNKSFKGSQQYAVNMCLCDNKKNLPTYKYRKNLSIESKFSHNYKSCDLCLRRVKAMVPNVTKKNSFRENDITKFSLRTEECTCLHKTPSNTSVDRLFTILNKWRDNLGESKNSNIEEALNADSLFKIAHESIVNVLQELCEQTGKTENKNNLKTIEQSALSDNNNRSLHKSEKKIDKDDEFSKTIMSSHLQIKQSKILIPLHLSDNVQNVKPYENNLLDNIPFAKTHVKEDTQEILIQSFLPVESSSIHNNFAGINTQIKSNNAELNIVREIPVMCMIQRSAANIKDSEKCIQYLGATLANATNKRTYDSPIINNTQRHKQVSNNNNYYSGNKLTNNYDSNSLNKQNSAKRINKVPKGVKTNNNCESYIQFLGVALENINANELLKRKTKKSRVLSNNKRHNRNHLFDDKRSNDCEDKSDGKMLQLSADKDSRKPRCAMNRITALNVVHVPNKCVLSPKDVEDFSDKSIEVKNSSNNFLSFEPCVCCPIPKDNISNDLEVNAFQLLEEHLKTKLDELRHTTCKSSCIQIVDEKCMFGDTLEKVKKLILESANIATCKCARNNKTDNGSWKRAYDLLQEYLKTKIDHVKCLCSSVENSQHENVVSQVLSQINGLIENDLQRLKNMCKCKDATLDINKCDSHNSNELQFITGETRNYNNTVTPNPIDQNYMPTSEKIKPIVLVTSTSGTILPQNKSAQVLLRQSVQTKSCDAIKTYNQYSEVQTADIVRTKLAIDNSINTESDNNFTLDTDDKIQTIDTTKNESNLHPGMHIRQLSKDTTAFQQRDITVLPIVMPEAHNLNKNDSEKNTSLIDDQLDKKEINYVKSEDIIEKPFMSYIGCTINCCCNRDLGCVCTKSTIPSKSEWLKADILWKKNTQEQGIIENVSYILNSIPKTVVQESTDSAVNVRDHRKVTEIIKLNHFNSDPYKFKVPLGENCYEEDLADVNNTKICETEVNANEEKHIYLIQSKQRLDVSYDTVNTLTDDSLQEVSMYPKEKYQCVKQYTHGILKKTSNSVSNSDTTLADRVPQTDCDCAMVPICHVKMLVENIKNKLINAECTCDSLKSVCPVHF